MEIQTLVKDIYSLIQRKDGWFNEQLASTFSRDVARRLQRQHNKETETPRLRLSQMGPRCPKALWYSIHAPSLAEALPPWAEVKYSYGHILEALMLTLAKASGHEVTGEQDEISLDEIVGHRDAVIDGCVVDVKSSSSRGFSKFKDGSLKSDDSFGYLDQLDGYTVGSRGDPLVRTHDKAYILAVDKQLGHVCLYPHEVTDEREEALRERIRRYKEIVASPNPPPCMCGTKPQGASGNVQLDIKASYSPFKYCCNPGLRTFLYSSGPVYLTHVERRPDVPEIDKHGRIV